MFTSIVASFGTEALAGYGIGARLEFLLIPIAFAFGVASTPMVGMAIGAGLVARARRVAWTTGAAVTLTVGLLGLIVAIKPVLWISLFTTIPASALRHRPISPGPVRRSASSDWASRCTSPRRARPRSAGRCWRRHLRLLLVGGRRLVAGVDPRPGLGVVRAGRRGDGRVRSWHRARPYASRAGANRSLARAFP